MDSMEKFEIKELPKIEEFYSTLNEEHISERIITMLRKYGMHSG